MSKLFVYAFSEKSHSARDISRGLEAKRILRENSSYQGSPDKTVINWGCSTLPPEVLKSKVINDPNKVANATNKLKFFKTVQKTTRVPEFTVSLDQAMEWLKQKQLVFARTQLNGRAGNDIIMMDKVSDFVNAPLYTVYKKKKEEYRVHFMFGEVIDVQQKILRTTDEEGNPIDPKSVDFRIRNHRNGFIFKRHDLHTPDDVLRQGTLAFKASGLDFGAIDIIWNETEQKAYVLELNTAPGLEGSTLDNYIRGFKTLGV